MKAQNTDRTERMGVGIATTAFESLGFAFREQLASDYGIDALAELIDSEHPTGQLLGLQLKSGSSYFSECEKDGYVFRTDKKHVDYWEDHVLPVLICLCDVDAGIVYWQVVDNETVISTGKGYRIDVPRNQIIDASSKDALGNLLTPIVPANLYTIFKTDDMSHGLAKRYSFKVVLNGQLNKAEVAAIVRQVTNEGQGRRYHRNHIVEGTWGDSDAHVVWTFIYPSAEDYGRNNHICRSSWIHKDLDPKFRPLGMDGENVGDDIIVEWSTHYDFLAEHASTNTLSKEDYFAKVIPLIEELKALLTMIGDGLLDLTEEKVCEDAFLTSTETARTRIDEIYHEITDSGLAPFECDEMDIKLQSFLASMHNLWLFYSDRDQSVWDARGRLNQALQTRLRAQEGLQHLEYELSKVR